MPNIYYILIAPKSGVAYREDGTIKLFHSRLDADFKADELHAADPDAVYLIEGPHSLDKLDWKARERARLLDKSHLPLIPELAAHCLPEHFAHVAKGDPRSLAYTKTEADGLRDIQKRMTVSAYLTTYAPTLDADTIVALQRKHQDAVSVAELQIATDPEDIVEVYTNGNGQGGIGSSCMRHDTSYFSGDQHPCVAYGDSDLAVAYTTDDRDRTTARAIVWPEKKVYSRMYGNERSVPELQRLMVAAGYKASKGYYGSSSIVSPHSLIGARIRAVQDGEGSRRYIVPYLDEGVWGVLDAKKEWITIVDHQPAGASLISIKETNGVAQVQGPRCPSCGSSSYEADTLAYISYPADAGQTRMHCINCRSSYTYVCAGTGQRFARDEVGYVRSNGFQYAQPWAEANLSMCGDCHSFAEESSLRPGRNSLSGAPIRVCRSCASDHYFWCTGLDTPVNNDLRVRALDVGPRKRVTFGEHVKLIDRGHSVLSPALMANPRFAELHAIALREQAEGRTEILCRVHHDTGMPGTNGLGAVVRYLGVSEAMCRLPSTHDIVVYSDEIAARLPRAGDWVRLGSRLDTMSECVGLYVDASGVSSHPVHVRLPDGREAYVGFDQITKVPDPQVCMRERPTPQVGDRVTFNHPSSPRFGQTGVIEAEQADADAQGRTLYNVRMTDGAMRRAAAARIQSTGPSPEPEADLLAGTPTIVPAPEPVAYNATTHRYRVGDRVRIKEANDMMGIRRSEIGRLGVVEAVHSNGEPRRVRTNDYLWQVDRTVIELVEAVIEIEAAE